MAKDSRELGDVFNQIIGANGCNMRICGPKYLAIIGYLRKSAQVVKMFTEGSAFFTKIRTYTKVVADNRQFVAGIEAVLTAAAIDISEYATHDFATVPEDVVKNFAEKYAALKSSSCVAALFNLCNNLIPYKRFISDVDHLDHKYLYSIPGGDFSPFPWTKFNLCEVAATLDFMEPKTDAGALFELLDLVICKMFNLAYNLYRTVSSPDVDIDEFVNIVSDKIQDLRQRVQRCKRAFDKLEESIKLLKNNFGVYYRDYIETQSSNVIIENFVMDVARNTRADPDLMRQFRSIVGFIRKASAGSSNPQSKMLFDKITEQFSRFDEYSNIRRDERGDDSDDEEEQPVPIEPEETAFEMQARTKNAERSVDELAAEINKM